MLLLIDAAQDEDSGGTQTILNVLVKCWDPSSQTFGLLVLTLRYVAHNLVVDTLYPVCSNSFRQHMQTRSEYDPFKVPTFLELLDNPPRELLEQGTGQTRKLRLLAVLREAKVVLAVCQGLAPELTSLLEVLGEVMIVGIDGVVPNEDP